MTNAIEAGLERIHKKCCLALNPITDMIVKRKVSKSSLEQVARDLQSCSKDVEKFIGEIK